MTLREMRGSQTSTRNTRLAPIAGRGARRATLTLSLILRWIRGLDCATMVAMDLKARSDL